MNGKCKEFFSNLLKKITDLYEIIKKCRVSIISVVLVSILSFFPQARDAFCSMAQSWLQFFLFEVSVILWAIFIWMSGRFILNQDFDAKRSMIASKKVVSKKRLYELFGEKYTLQIFGVLGFIAINIAMFMSVKGIENSYRIYCLVILNTIFVILFLFSLFTTWFGMVSYQNYLSQHHLSFSRKEFETSSIKVKSLRIAIEGSNDQNSSTNDREDLTWLNERLEETTFYKNLWKKGQPISSEDTEDREINSLIEKAKIIECGECRKLSIKKRCYIKRLNRLLMERVYPNETPVLQRRITNIREYSNPVKWIARITMAVFTIYYIFFMLFPHGFSQTLGTLSTLMFGCTFFVIITTLMAWFSERSRLPILAPILIIAIIAGKTGCNNNHDIRKADTKLSQPTENFFTPGGLYESWLKKMDIEYKTETVHPMFIVAASGGGIRAAYWTASVLGMLQDKNEYFASHTIVISPVSGSALGSLVFVNLLANNFEQGKYAAISQTVLSRDFLAPALASFFFYDLPTRFIFFPCKSIPDRAEILEKAWESAWYPKNSNNSSESLLKDFLGKESPFSKPFSSLLQYESSHKIPILLINGTIVETGERILTAHLNMNEEKDEHGKKKINEFSYCKNLFDIPPFNDSDIRMSTAAMMSARFPIISPAGTIYSGKIEYHILDGGFFDNSGAATALDFYESIVSEIDLKKVIPVFIQIDNSKKGENKALSWWNRIFSGLQLPLLALYNAGDAHANEIKKWIEEYSADGKIKYFQYMLQDKDEENDVDVPLSWFLSRESQKCIQGQLKEAKNGAVTADIIKLLPKVSKQEMNIRIDIE